MMILCMKYEFLEVFRTRDLACINFFTHYNSLRQFDCQDTIEKHGIELGNLRNFGFTYYL